MRFTLTSVAAMIVFGRPAFAEEPQPITLTIEARAIESPLLKYRLFPAESEIKPGNAAPILLRLPWEQTPWMTETFPTLHEWQSRPLDASEWKTSANVLPDAFYNEMKRAAFRRDAYWEYPIGETPSPYLILLPDVQGLRRFLGAGLSARIRYHLSRGELDKARDGILVGLTNSQHLARTPFYINQLVALEIHQTMLKRTDELVARPNSPNLYWALTTLPVSLIELDRAARFECDIFALTFPAANDLNRPRDAKEWNKMARQLAEFLETVGEIPKLEPPREDGSVVEQFLRVLKPLEKTLLTKAVKQARADLPRMLGISAERVAAMSDDEAGLRWYAYLRMARDQHAAAVLSLAPREAWPELRKLQAEIESMREKTGIKGMEFLSPTSIYVSAWSLKRKIDSLRIVEAVRHHLATHNGQLPETLDDIKAVSIPVDPLTGQSFEWKVDGKIATLKAPPLPADAIEPGSSIATANALEYQLHVK
jgi:hypothetical protein